jgi:molecular chaperone DnaK (HSP70)
MSRAWAIDLGTTNTGVARWDDGAGEPQLVELGAVCRRAGGEDPLEAARLVPSAVEVLPQPGFWGRLGRWAPLRRGFFIGTTALIGRRALDRSYAIAHPGFVPGFKTALESDPLRVLARAGARSVSARRAATEFLRELLAEVHRETGSRIRDLVFTVPVDAYEAYRAELQAIARSLGVRRVRFLDEPLAAALGYGLGLAGRKRTVLVADMGGGTLHLALVELTDAGAETGEARVIAKEGRPLGGNAVDGWLLDEVCRRAGYDLEGTGDAEPMRLWRRLMLAEACRVKEAVFFQETTPFLLTPPGLTRRVDARRAGGTDVEVSRRQLEEILEREGFFQAIDECLAAVVGDQASAIDDVVMVGGSTLLPGVFPRFEERFGRARVRAWQPFEAVAYGAAAFAAERFSQRDFIVHDYAFVTHEARTGKAVHTVVVPRGTRFPTRPDLWKHHLVPTCSLGEAESLFKLVICEIGRADGGRRRHVWDAAGDLRTVGGEGDPLVVVPLNEANPTLGYLDPPHPPGDRRPRLELAFGVSEDRWLLATVVDLWGGKKLLDAEPVVRLL